MRRFGMLAPNPRRPGPPAPASTIRTDIMFNTLVRKYNSWQQYRRTYDELSRLSNRELSDLGIGRGDIDFIARSHTR